MSLRYKPLSIDESLPKLDFTEEDGSDPLEINHFYKEECKTYQKNNLSKVWIVRDEDEGKKPVAYFTVSMNAIEVEILGKNEKVDNVSTKRYPSMLIGRMGVAKKFRNRGVSKRICRFCIGLAVVIGERVACRYVVLQTSLDKVPVYTSSGFIKSENEPRHGKVWLYYKIA